MSGFIRYLDEIEKLRREKRYNEAWRVANRGITELSKVGDEMWFALYYQMALILAKEKRWQEALEKIGFVIHHLGGLGGVGHQKFTLCLLKKFGMETKLADYVQLSLEKKPVEFGVALSQFLQKK